MEELKIDRKTVVGFGYCAGTIPGIRGGFMPMPDYPDITGTVKKVQRKIEKLYPGIGNEPCKSCWFVKHRGEWRRVESNSLSQQPSDLLKPGGLGKRKYLYDSITVKVE